VGGLEVLDRDLAVALEQLEQAERVVHLHQLGRRRRIVRRREPRAHLAHLALPERGVVLVGLLLDVRQDLEHVRVAGELCSFVRPRVVSCTPDAIAGQRTRERRARRAGITRRRGDGALYRGPRAGPEGVRTAKHEHRNLNEKTRFAPLPFVEL
jgi:hypothetical protein